MKILLTTAAVCCLAGTGCSGVSEDDAKRLVEQYTDAVSEAYRRGDVELIDTIVAPNSKDGKNLTGLIGVRLDIGITMDAEVLELRVKKVEESPGELRVTTAERWNYRDREIGTGEQVGEASTDSYEMLYIFKKVGKAWMVEETRFASPPVVGRKEVPWKAEVESMHGVMSPVGLKEGAKQ